MSIHHPKPGALVCVFVVEICNPPSCNPPLYHGTGRVAYNLHGWVMNGLNVYGPTGVMRRVVGDSPLSLACHISSKPTQAGGLRFGPILVLKSGSFFFNGKPNLQWFVVFAKRAATSGSFQPQRQLRHGTVPPPNGTGPVTTRDRSRHGDDTMPRHPLRKSCMSLDEIKPS